MERLSADEKVAVITETVDMAKDALGLVERFHPVSVQMAEYVTDEGGTGLHAFVVYTDGDATALASCRRLSDGNGGYLPVDDDEGWTGCLVPTLLFRRMLGQASGIEEQFLGFCGPMRPMPGGKPGQLVELPREKPERLH